MFDELVQRHGERPEDWYFNAFLSTTDRDSVDALTRDFPKRWHFSLFRFHCRTTRCVQRIALKSGHPYLRFFRFVCILIGWPRLIPRHCGVLPRNRKTSYNQARFLRNSFTMPGKPARGRGDCIELAAVLRYALQIPSADSVCAV